MNENWTKWLILSVSKHFNDNLKDCYIDGEDRQSDQRANVFEVRYLGPDFDILSKNEIRCRLTINCQIITAKNIVEPALHLERIGNAQKVMFPCINIYKFGKNSDTDTGELFTTLQLKSDIKTTNFGTVDVVSRLVRTTVEVVYETTIGG